MASTVRFVDSIAASPSVRLDVNDKTTWRTMFDGSDFSPPPILRSYSTSLMADGARIPASAFGNRIITLSLVLQAASQDAAATALQTLHRELNRPQNFLQYQPGTTAPVWFRTFRTPPEEIRVVRDSGRALWYVTVPVEAEPFAYGLKESIAAVTITDDPAAGTNRMSWEVTSVKGDVDTPAKVSWPRASGAVTRTVLFASRRRGTPSSALFFHQAEAATQGTDTSTQANVATYSGTSNNYSRCTFATATMTTRLTWNVGTAGVDMRGRYRVFLRYTMTGADGSVQVRWVNDDADVFGPTTELASGTRCHADLGLVTFPCGADVPGDGFSGVEVGVDSIGIALQAERVSGSSNLDVDYILFIPADDQLTMISTDQTSGTPTGTWIWDGPNQTVYAVNGSGNIDDETPLQGFQGSGALRITPGVTNRLYFMRQIAPGVTNTITDTTAVTVEYWPLYLNVRPAST